MDTCKIGIPYGQKTLWLRLPRKNIADVLVPHPVRPVANEVAEVERALRKPIGTPPLTEIIKPSDNVALLCENITRPTPLATILPPVLAQLHRLGVPKSNIRIIMALGSHRPMISEEIRSKVGELIYEQYEIKNSEFRDPRRLQDLGFAPQGVRVWIDREALEADIRVGVGSIAPHPVAGYTGGAKIIYPGVAGEETVAHFHLRAALLGRNVYGEVDNPIRQEMETLVDTVGLHFIINSIFTVDDKVYKVVAGHYVHAHREGAKLSQQVYCVESTREADAVIVSSAPLDLDLWQASKALIAADRVVKKGGTIVLVTPCYEGQGPHPTFLDYCGSHNIRELLREAQRGLFAPQEILPLSVAALVSYICERARVVVVSDGLTKGDAKRAGFLYCSTVDEAVSYIFAMHGPNAIVSVIPFGAHTCPYIAERC